MKRLRLESLALCPPVNRWWNEDSDSGLPDPQVLPCIVLISTSFFFFPLLIGVELSPFFFLIFFFLLELIDNIVLTSAEQ